MKSLFLILFGFTLALPLLGEVQRNTAKAVKEQCESKAFFYSKQAADAIHGMVVSRWVPYSNP